MKTWQQIQPAGGDFTLQPGNRYAALASASLNYSLPQIVSYLAGRGFAVSYSWEQGQPSRGLYPVDLWLQSQAPDTTDNHRWIYLEGNYTGTDPLTVGQDAPWPLTIYSVGAAFEAVDTSTAAPQLPAPVHCAPAPARWPWALGGLALGIAGGWFVAR